jgi:hypothetical protein
MSIKEEIVLEIDSLSEEEQFLVLEYAKHIKKATPLTRFRSLMDEAAQSIPDEEQNNVPTDLTSQADDYLYGI